jgi:hypothetical protein
MRKESMERLHSNAVNRTDVKADSNAIFVHIDVREATG